MPNDYYKLKRDQEVPVKRNRVTHYAEVDDFRWYLVEVSEDDVDIEPDPDQGFPDHDRLTPPDWPAEDTQVFCAKDHPVLKRDDGMIEIWLAP